MLDRLTIERMAAKAGDTPILIALSGGGDSTALLFLLSETIDPSRLRAVVVDHALRDGSADDAASAASASRRLGIQSEVRTPNWPNGPRRAQQAAREARYRALCDAAREHGAHVIAVAHTADDQAETVLMRAAAGSSWRGLAGIAAMAPAPVWPEGRGIALARPLLGVRRAALREDLRQRGASWIEDPANANPAFERVRVRERLAALEAAGLDPMRLVELAASLRLRSDALDRAASALIREAARFEEDRITLSRAAWRGSDDVRRRALSALIAAAAGAPREPAAESLTRLAARIAADDFRGASLGGARIARVGDTLVLNRDRGALEGRADGTAPYPPACLQAGIETVCDGRVALTMSEPGWQAVFESGAFHLQRGEKRAALAAASPQWLIKKRVQHALERD